MKIPLLVLNKLSNDHQQQIARIFQLIYAPTPDERATALALHGRTVRAVLTNGAAGLTTEEIAQLPELEIICAMGAGYERIDVAAARARNIALANGIDTNAECVADHAMGLLISTVRNFRELDRLCRMGVWNDWIASPVNVSSKRLGILGLGTIGMKVAQRALGFSMEIRYHNRHRRNDLTFDYAASLTELAAWCDVLLIAAPGGEETKHLVDAKILNALGPSGYLINVGRGSIVDTRALASALQTGQIAGAGLDVYETEPAPPIDLIGLNNLIITPHVAGWSPEATQASVDRFLANAVGYFEGNGPVTPIRIQ